MKASPPRLLLVTVAGPDTPGITAGLAKVIADNEVELSDIEQVVVHGQLTLCLLLRIDPRPSHGDPVIKDLLFTAKSMGLEMKFEVLDEDQAKTAPDLNRYAVTAIADKVGGHGLFLIADVLKQFDANIENIRQLSEGQVSSLEAIIALGGGETKAQELRAELVKRAYAAGIDIAVQPESLTRRSKRLIVMDMDSTLIQMEVIDELARRAGVVEKVSAITERAMAGELDFDQSLRSRVALLQGMPFEDAMAVAKNLPLTEGAQEAIQVLRMLGYKTGIISGGFDFAANTLKETLGLDYAYSNRLEICDGKLTGKVLDPILGPQRKADLLETIAQGEGISLDQTIAIGDGANDLSMLQKAGLGIAFHAKAKLRDAADTALTRGGLDRILYLLGLHARDVSQLLKSAGGPASDV